MNCKRRKVGRKRTVIGGDEKIGEIRENRVEEIEGGKKSKEHGIE